jgi:hypothetical protein
VRFRQIRAYVLCDPAAIEAVDASVRRLDFVFCAPVVDRLADHSDPSAQSITLGEIVIDAKVGGDWRRALAWSSVPTALNGLKAGARRAIRSRFPTKPAP